MGVAGGDRIDLSTLDANAILGGNQAFAFIGSTAFTAAGQLRVQNLGAATLVQVNVDAALGADLEIIIQDGAIVAANYAALDFIL